MAQSDTVERILDAAASLFAERGFAETSLRMITSEANVNLAAVNYHFGSKKSLIQAVFSRFLSPLSAELNERLALLRQTTSDITAQQLVGCLFESLMASTEKEGENPAQFMQLLALAYAQTQEHLRHYIMAEHGASYVEFTRLLREALPDIEPDVFYWRLCFMLGASMFTLSAFDSISGILKSDYGKETSVDDAVALLIPAVIGMLESSK